MKKLIVAVIILLIAVLMTQTVPDKEAHKEAMMKAVKDYVNEEAENRGFGDNILTNLGKSVVNKTIEVALNSKLKVNNYYLFNTTNVRLKGKDQLLSVGMFGHVFTFDKEMLREKLEEAAKAKEEAISEREAAKLSERELKKLEREQKKREKELAREQKRREKELAKEQKRLAKEQKRLEKEQKKLQNN